MKLLFVLRTLVSAFNPRKGDLTTLFLWNLVGHLPTMSSFKLSIEPSHFNHR